MSNKQAPEKMFNMQIDSTMTSADLVAWLKSFLKVYIPSQCCGETKTLTHLLECKSATINFEKHIDTSLKYYIYL
jgi:hypothetical protein